MVPVRRRRPDHAREPAGRATSTRPASRWRSPRWAARPADRTSRRRRRTPRRRGSRRCCRSSATTRARSWSRQRGDIVELRVELQPSASPDEPLAGWMLQMSAIRGAAAGHRRLGHALRDRRRPRPPGLRRRTRVGARRGPRARAPLPRERALGGPGRGRRRGVVGAAQLGPARRAACRARRHGGAALGAGAGLGADPRERDAPARAAMARASGGGAGRPPSRAGSRRSARR